MKVRQANTEPPLRIGRDRGDSSEEFRLSSGEKKVSGGLAQIPALGSLRFPEGIGIGGAVTHSPLPHHRTYGAVYGGSAG
jgi:hypothetical protein